MIYNSQAMVQSQTDARGNTTTFEYEANGLDLKKAYDPLGHCILEITRDAARLPVTTKDGLQRTTSMTYNDAGQVLTVTPSGQAVQSYTYDEGHQLRTVNQANLLQRTLTYDALGRLESDTNQDGFTRSFEYDGLNRLTRLKYPDGTFEQMEWLGSIKKRQTDRMGRTTQFFHDNLGQLLLQRAPDGTTVEFRYDPVGRCTQLIDSRRNVTAWDYDARGRVNTKTLPNGDCHQMTYDAVGNILTSTDPAGVVTTCTYDLDNHLTNRATPGVASVSYTYDELGRRKTFTDDIGTTTWTHDDASQVTGISAVASDGAWTDTFSFVYDSLGRVTSQTINGVETASQFDPLGRISGMDTQAGHYTFNYRGTASAQLASVAYPNGQTTTFAYHPNSGDQRLQTLWHKAGNTPTAATISKFDYEYDPAGQITQWTQQAASDVPLAYSFGYDKKCQLPRAVLKNTQTGTVQKTFGYNYDAAGNWTLETIDSAVSQDTHNNANQLMKRSSGGAIPIRGVSDKTLASVNVNANPATITGGTNFFGVAAVTTGSNTVTVTAKDTANPQNVTTKQYAVTVADGAASTKTLTYDPNGNLLGDGTRTFEWDARNRLIAINKGTHRTEFTYDGLDRRVIIVEKENAQEQSKKRLVWNGLTIAEERDGVTNTLSKRFNGMETTIATGPKAGTYFLTRDHLGSVREMTDGSMTIRAHYEYDPYGRQTKTTGDLDSDFGFTGHYFHAPSGLLLAPYRAYDPDLGRWISRDPIAEDGGLNLYGYVMNDPISGIDPLGLAVGAPGTAESFIPIWGSGRAAINDFQTGHPVWGAVNTALAVSDVFLVKSLATAAGKGLVKAGSNTWAATSRWLTNTGWREFPGQQMHHWLIPQNGWGEAIPTWLKNQPWNLMGMRDQAFHTAIHGWGPDAFNLAERLWFGSPDWAKVLLGDALGKWHNAWRDEGQCFVAGTLVRTKDGLKSIEDIQIEEQVWAFDEETGSEHLSIVDRKYVNSTDSIVRIDVDDTVIESTPTHPFWVETVGWTLARDLKSGDKLKCFDGHVGVVKLVESQAEETTVYNLEVRDFHTYFVSPLSVGVHNRCGK